MTSLNADQFMGEVSRYCDMVDHGANKAEVGKELDKLVNDYTKQISFWALDDTTNKSLADLSSRIKTTIADVQGEQTATKMHTAAEKLRPNIPSELRYGETSTQPGRPPDNIPSELRYGDPSFKPIRYNWEPPSTDTPKQHPDIPRELNY